MPGRGEERDSLTFSSTFLVNFYQEEARSPDPLQSSISNLPVEGCQGWPRDRRSPSGQPGPPPPPGLVFPSFGGWAWGWGARTVDNRIAEPESRRDSGGTRSFPGGGGHTEVSGWEPIAQARTRKLRGGAGALPSSGGRGVLVPGFTIALFTASPLPFGDDLKPLWDPRGWRGRGWGSTAVQASTSC